jgi:branched-chain amino acid transport system permease protein
VAGAMMVFLWYGGAEYNVFNINQSFLILFMVIIGGLGSLIGSFLGAGLIFMLPIAMGIVLPAIFGPLGIRVGAETIEHLRFMILGALIIFFLIVEPHGLARLWQIAKQKLRVWPFPY